MLGYPSNILRYPSIYWNYSSKTKLGLFPHSLCQVDNFFTLYPPKNIIEHKDVEFNFRMGCIHALFPFLWIINVQFTNFGFFILLFSNPNQKFIVVATSRMVENVWLWSIILGNANEARKLRGGYHRLSKDFFYIGKCNFKQQWPSMAFTSVPYMVMKINRNSNSFW